MQNRSKMLIYMESAAVENLMRSYEDGIFIAWGARGREFESRHPDQRNQRLSSHKELGRFDFRAHWADFCPFVGNSAATGDRALVSEMTSDFSEALSAGSSHANPPTHVLRVQANWGSSVVTWARSTRQRVRCSCLDLLGDARHRRQI